MKRLSLNLERAKAYHDGRLSRIWMPMNKQPSFLNGQTDIPSSMSAEWLYGASLGKVKPPFSFGEIVFVAEPWLYPVALLNDKKHRQDLVIYQADGDERKSLWRWKSPALMPEWASRAKVKILSCAPQRVQDVTAENIRSEGVIIPPPYIGVNYEDGSAIERAGIEKDPWDYWKDIIESIYPGAWERNSWGWAVELERV